MLQASVKRYESERRSIMQLHQIKRAQIYAGPVTDVLLFRRIVDNQSGGRHLANASDLETYDDVIRGE